MEALILCLLAAFALVFLVVTLMFVCIWVPMLRMMRRNINEMDKQIKQRHTLTNHRIKL